MVCVLIVYFVLLCEGVFLCVDMGSEIGFVFWFFEIGFVYVGGGVMMWWLLMEDVG